MGFNNPITGQQGALIRQSIHSPNYVAGSSGWTINKDGTAEFNSATFRGTVIIEQNNAILFYSGVPATGNLVASFSPVAGTDSFGNMYPAGMMVRIGNSNIGVVVGYNGTAGLIYFPGPVANVLLDAKIQLNTNGAGNSEQSFLTIGSAEDSTQLDAIFANYWASSKDGTGMAHASTTYNASDGSFQTYHTVSLSGTAMIGKVTAIHPGTGTSRANYAVAETWQTPALNAGWATGPAGGTFQPVQYRVDADGNLMIIGAFHSTSATPTAIIFTLPTGYFNPSEGHRSIVIMDKSGTLTPNCINISLTGDVTLLTAITATTTDVYVDLAGRIS